ncbi:MAG: DegT/DnrJ/EryC1/StrS family aminotransferase [Clostridiaceae bacterium]|nr:DegT/DnrJ/EryC1/StrS family aminotransferase [Clostridiaceae bacterium]
MPAIRHPLPSGTLCACSFDEREVEAAVALLRTPEKLFRHRGEPTNADLFEREACALTGAPHALMVNSGTSALSCCLAGLGIGPGDDVIVPAYTYIATASSVINVGAIPILAEVDESLGLDPADFERKITPYTKAVIATHMQGVPCKVDAIRSVAKKHGLYMIEDCCQAIGARYKGDYCGVHSDAFAWSLNYYKTITCGEGGVAFLQDARAHAKAVCQSDPANLMWKSGLISEDTQPFSKGGYRISELSAAIARVQLTKLEGIVATTRALKKRLIAGLASPQNYILQVVDDPDGDAGLSFAIIGNTTDATKRMTASLASEGLRVGSIYNEGFPDRHIYAYWDSIMEQYSWSRAGYPWKDPAYKGEVHYSRDMCPRTLDILSRCMRISLNTRFTEENIDEIADAINIADAAVSV